MAENFLDKKAIIAELIRSEHGDLSTYLPVGRRAAQEDPNFFAHLVAWNHVKGQVRDSKVALPMIQLSSGTQPEEFLDNALAHLADLTPQIFKRAVIQTTRFEKKTKQSLKVEPFAKTVKAPNRVVRRLVTRYLRDLEADKRQFEYVAVQHSRTLHRMYTHYHVPRPEWVGRILFNGEKDKPKNPADWGIFGAIHELHRMPLELAAGTIVKFKIPFLIARGALGKKAKETDTVLALIKAMTPTELVTNIKWLEKLGVKTDPVLRAAFEAAIGKAATAKTPRATLKTTRAAEAVADDEVLSGKLHALQEKQLDKMGGIDGDWAVLADKSGSMRSAIETGAHIAGVLSRMVKGKVHLIFFDNIPYHAEVTNRTLEEILQSVRRIAADGGTNMDCGIRLMMDKGIQVDGMVFVSDGANHGPAVVPTYRRYCQKFDCEPTLYYYQLPGEPDNFAVECAREKVDLITHDLRGKPVDFYSLPNLVQTMRVQRYSLVDEIMNTPLRTLDEVLDKTAGMPVLPQRNLNMAVL